MPRHADLRHVPLMDTAASAQHYFFLESAWTATNEDALMYHHHNSHTPISLASIAAAYVCSNKVLFQMTSMPSELSSDPPDAAPARLLPPFATPFRLFWPPRLLLLFPAALAGCTTPPLDGPRKSARNSPVSEGPAPSSKLFSWPRRSPPSRTSRAAASSASNVGAPTTCTVSLQLPNTAARVSCEQPKTRTYIRNEIELNSVERLNWEWT